MWVDGGRRVVVAAFLAVSLATVAFGSLRLALGQVLGVERGSLLLAGLPVSTFFLGRGLSATLSGFVYDAEPGVARLAPGLALLGVALVVYAMGVFLGEPLLLVALSGVQGFLAGMVWPLVQTSVARYSGASATLLSAYFALGSFGIAAGRLLYPHLSSLLGDRGVFTVASLLYTGAGLVLLEGFRSLELGSRRPGARRVLLVRGAWRVLAVNMASGFIAGFDAQLVYPLLVKVKHVDKFLASYSLAAAAAASVPVKLAVGRLADRKGLRDALLLVAALVAGSLLGLSAALGPVAALCAATYLAFSSSLVPLARLAAYIEGVRLGSPTGIVGVSNTFSNIGSLLAPVAAPLLVAIGLLPLYPAPLLAVSLLVPREPPRAAVEAVTRASRRP